jgi:hypothetical protein
MIVAVTFNYSPHPAQRKIHEARDTRFRVVCTGRRFGKTLCLAAELLDRGGCERGGDYGWVAPTYNVAERGIEAFREIAEGFVRIAGRTPTRVEFEHVVVPGNVKTIEDDAFRNSSALVSVDLGEGIETIGNNSFWMASEVAEIALPKSVKHIRNRAFAASGITEMILPDGVTNIGQLTFNNCSRLKRVVARGVTNVENYAFERCSALTRVEWGETVPYFSSHNPYFETPNVTNYYPAGATEWLALDPQTVSGRPAAMMESHATTLSSVAAGRRTLDDLFLAANVQTQAATPETDPAKVYSAPAVEQAMSLRADWSPTWLDAVNGTVTVSKASGRVQAYVATEGVTVAIGPGSSNTVSSINFFMDTGGYSHTWLTNGVEYIGALPAAGTANVIFYSPLFSREWTGNVVE